MNVGGWSNIHTPRTQALSPFVTHKKMGIPFIFTLRLNVFSEAGRAKAADR